MAPATIDEIPQTPVPDQPLPWPAQPATTPEPDVPPTDPIAPETPEEPETPEPLVPA
jgi:hypothetical protein